MKTIPGKLKIDAVFLGEITIELLGSNVVLRTKVGYHNSKEQRNMGSTLKTAGWSPSTMRKLDEFIEALEQDVAAELFEGGAASSGEAVEDPTMAGVPQL